VTGMRSVGAPTPARGKMPMTAENIAAA